MMGESSSKKPQRASDWTGEPNEPQATDTNNILCDIIAQQREFQLRASKFNSSIRSGKQQPSLANNNNSSHLFELEHQSSTLSSGSFGGSNKPTPRRKFSLSFAMSSLAPAFGGSSGSVQQPATSGGQRAADQLKQTRPPAASGKRGLQHRASLVGVTLTERTPVALGAGGDLQPAAEKKKSFVHKAIRRGSKLFDSMLLSSAQQQAAASGAGDERRDSLNFRSAAGETRRGTEEATSRQQQQPATNRVQFASDADHEHERDEEPEELAGSGATRSTNAAPRHRRCLRLGSFQHDLRRALSLSSNSVHSHHNQSQATEKKQQRGQSKQATAEQVASRERQPPEVAGSENVAAKLKQMNPGKRGSFQQPQPQANAGRLRRKNSLFAPLTSAATSAFYHASHGGSSGKHKRGQEAQVQPPAQVAANQEQAAASNQQTGGGGSASFSLCQDHSRTYKLIIFGSSAVGKTSIIQRFLYGHFPVAHKPTVEELHSNKYNIPEMGEIYLEILDTSGTFEFPAMRRLSIEKGDAFILVYSVADPASWQEVVHLRQLILEEKGEQPDVVASTSAAGDQTETVAPPPPARPPRAAQHSTGTGGSQRNSQTGDEAAAPISSVYAAATRLTSGRRASLMSPSSPMSRPASCGASSGSSASQQPQSTGNVPFKPNGHKSSAHYNNQLSRLLQQNPGSKSPPSSRLLSQSISFDDNQAPEGVAQQSAEGAKSSNKSSSSSEQQADRRKQQPAEPKAPARTKQKPTAPASSKRRTPIVVVANKCDLEATSVQVQKQDEAERLVCEQWGNSFVRCSAKEALNVDRVFKELLRQARAPEILSQFVIDDHQQRRQSLPVLKNQLSAHHVKGLRSLYNQHQLQQTATSQTQLQQLKQLNSASNNNNNSNNQQDQPPRSMSSASDDSQCAIM